MRGRTCFFWSQPPLLPELENLHCLWKQAFDTFKHGNMHLDHL